MYFEHSAIYKMESVCYGFDLRPRVSIRNTLPIPIVISIASCGVTRDEEADEKLAQQIKDMSVTSANKSVSGRHEKSIDDFLDCGEKIVGPGEKMVRRRRVELFLVFRCILFAPFISFHSTCQPCN